MVAIEVDVSQAQRQRLESVLPTTLSVEDALLYVLRAGAQEGLDYATGQAIFSSMADLRMYRVYNLILAGMPASESEPVVAALFKVPLPTARRLIANTFARYSADLTSNVASEVRAKLDAATAVDGEKWQMTLPPGFVKDAIIAACAASDKSDPTHVKASVWAFPRETYNFLRERYEMPERQWAKPPKASKKK